MKTTFKQFLSENDLGDLAIVVALRKELNIGRRDAETALAWLRNEIGGKLPEDAQQGMFALFDAKLRKNNTQPHDVDEFIQLWMRQHLKKKYKLDIGPTS